MKKRTKKLLPEMLIASAGTIFFALYVLNILRGNNYSAVAISGCAVGLIYAVTFMCSKFKDKRSFVFMAISPIFAFLTLGIVAKLSQLALGVLGYQIVLFSKDFFLCLGIASWLGLCLVFLCQNVKAVTLS